MVDSHDTSLDGIVDGAMKVASKVVLSPEGFSTKDAEEALSQARSAGLSVVCSIGVHYVGLFSSFGL